MSQSVSEKRPVGRPRTTGLNPQLGSRTSVRRLDGLNFDPITELVIVYQKIELEIERQEKIRDKIIVELNGNGSAKAYRAEVHHALFDKLVNIGEKLLRYRYGRVPENNEEKTRLLAPLVVNLTKKGETYVVGGDDQPDLPQDDPSYDDEGVIEHQE